ncbi:MAG: nodulation protein NfeD [Actinobacteria bacterium]|nr:nodulation protein NfeD [Actinomycetota bacterium]
MISERSRSKSVARLMIAAVFLVAGAMLLSLPANAQTNVIEFVELEGVIDPVSSRFLLRQIDNAEANASKAIIVRIDTPGGLDISMRQMVQRILNARVPVIVWVSPPGARAASAGVFIVYASHVAAMSPATNLGAAHPVDLGGGGDETTAAKAVNDAAAYIREIAIERGRNPDFAEDAVRESASIGAEEALEEDVIEIIAADIHTLTDGLNGRQIQLGDESVTLDLDGASLRFHKMGLLERILHTVVRPEIAYMLLLLGFYGLIFELYNPGIGAAGVLGGIALLLGFYALSILPTSWAGVGLIALGIIFLVVDLHVAGLGIFTIGGVLALVAGSLLLFAGADPALRLAWWAIAGAVVASMLFFISVMTAAIRSRSIRPVQGSEALVGTFGVARTDIAPEGQISARGSIWRARTAGMAIGEGAPVKILGVSGLSVMVEEARQEEIEQSKGGEDGRIV